MANTLLVNSPNGLYCPAGDFYIDPWKPVERAIITHAHGDHARVGSTSYLCAREGELVLRTRLGADALIQSLPYDEPISMNSVRVSMHPAGHILGSSQIRLELGGEIWVVSGDYKTESDPTCTSFTPVRCHTFVTESTFGLPIYNWPDSQATFQKINDWWRSNQERDRTSVLFAYALGKAQRLLAGLSDIGPIFTHGAVEKLNDAYRASGKVLPHTQMVSSSNDKKDWKKALVLAPPSAQGTPWLRKFGNFSSASASGWMTIRGTRRRRAFDRGFILSDHADWQGLLSAIAATGAERVWVTHGYVPVLVRFLREKGIFAEGIATQFVGEQDDVADEGAESTL